jgi:hypothetical protein
MLLQRAGPQSQNVPGPIGPQNFVQGQTGQSFGGWTPTGTTNLGINTTPGQIWGAPQQTALRSRLARVAGMAMPYVGGGQRAGTETNRAFNELLRGMTGRVSTNVGRQGARAEGTFRLAALRDAIANALSAARFGVQQYGSQLTGQAQEQQLLNRMLGALT